MTDITVEKILIALTSKCKRCMRKIKRIDDGDDENIEKLHLINKIEFYNNKRKIILNYLKTINRGFITKNNSIIYNINNKEKNKLEKHICPICISTHKYKDLIKTSCGHIYGKKCFEELIQSTGENYEFYLFDKIHIISCPMCRNDKLNTHIFSIKNSCCKLSYFNTETIVKKFDINY
jgi:hypothetical protein